MDITFCSRNFLSKFDFWKIISIIFEGCLTWNVLFLDWIVRKIRFPSCFVNVAARSRSITKMARVEQLTKRHGVLIEKKSKLDNVVRCLFKKNFRIVRELLFISLDETVIMINLKRLIFSLLYRIIVSKQSRHLSRFFFPKSLERSSLGHSEFFTTVL